MKPEKEKKYIPFIFYKHRDATRGFQAGIVISVPYIAPEPVYLYPWLFDPKNSKWRFSKNAEYINACWDDQMR